MIPSIKRMARLGYIDTTIAGGEVILQFTKYDGNGYITDIINYFYSKETGVEVFTNNLKQQCGSRLNKELLYAVQVIFCEIDDYFKKEKEQ